MIEYERYQEAVKRYCALAKYSYLSCTPYKKTDEGYEFCDYSLGRASVECGVMRKDLAIALVEMIEKGWLKIFDYIESNYKFKEYPVGGSSFITPRGLFLYLREKGYDHRTFATKLNERGFEADIETELVPPLVRAGWIRCNDARNGKMPYMEIVDQPTKEQYGAIKKWVERIIPNAKEIKLTVIGEVGQLERIYSTSSLSVDDLVNEIKRAYETGEIKGIPSRECLEKYRNRRNDKVKPIDPKRRRFFDYGRGEKILITETNVISTMDSLVGSMIIEMESNGLKTTRLSFDELNSVGEKVAEQVDVFIINCLTAETPFEDILSYVCDGAYLADKTVILCCKGVRGGSVWQRLGTVEKNEAEENMLNLCKRFGVKQAYDLCVWGRFGGVIYCLIDINDRTKHKQLATANGDYVLRKE